MEIILAVVIGLMFAASLYLMMRRSLVKLIIGLALLANSVNLLVFTVGRLSRGAAPVIPAGQETITGAFANPLPQALVLTAIVIGFGFQAFAVALFSRVYNTVDTVDLDKMRDT